MAGFADRVHWTDQVFILGASRTKIPPPPLHCCAFSSLSNPRLRLCFSLSCRSRAVSHQRQCGCFPPDLHLCQLVELARLASAS